MKNDFASSAILLLILNCLCIDVWLIVLAYRERIDHEEFYLNALMGAVWGQYALCCAARLRFVESPGRTKAGLVAIPILGLLVYSVVDPTEQLTLMLTLLLMCFALTALICLAPATILRWLVQKQGRQLGMKHLFVLTSVFAVASFGCSQLDFAGMLLLVFFLAALPSMVACVMLSLPDQPIIYSVTMVIFLLTVLIADQFDLYHRFIGNAQEIFVSQMLCLWLGGQFMIAAGRTTPNERKQVT